MPPSPINKNGTMHGASTVDRKAIKRQRMASRGAHTMNSIFFKPTMMRKSCQQRKSFTSDATHGGSKADAEEAKSKKLGGESSSNGVCWVPHERTGIYYPKGQEKLMQDIPISAAKDLDVNWFSCPARHQPL